MGIIGNLMYAVGFRVADSALRLSERQTASLTKMVIGLGGAIGSISFAAIGHQAVTAASEFTNAMTKIQQSTDMTNQQLEATKGIAKNLYNQNFGQDWNDLGTAIAVTNQITQQQGKELENTTKNALLLRDAFGHDVTESVKTADTMMKQFGISSEASFNLLAQGQRKGLDKSGELLDTANEYANQFKSLGFTAEEMFDTLAAGSQNGAFNLDKVGDAVKEFNIRSKDGSKASIEAFQMLGLNADEMMQTFARGGPEAKQAFNQVMQMISAIEDPVQRNTVGVGLMGTQFEDLEADIIAAMGTAQNQFDMTRDTMGELNQAKIDSPGQALSLIGRQLETGLLIPLGQTLLPLIMLVSEGIGFFTDHLDIIGPAIGGVAAVLIGAMVPSMWAAAVAGWAMMAPFLPIIGLALLVGAAIAGAILIFRNWGTIGPWLAQKWLAFKEWTISIFNSVVQFFQMWGTTMLVILGGPIAWIVALVSKYWDQIKTFTVAVFTGIWNWLTSIWQSIVNTVTDAGTAIWTNIQSMWDKITGLLTGINLFDVGKNIIDGLIQGISSMATAVFEKVKSISTLITDGIKDFLGIHSPSRVMMEVGFFTGEGLAQGIEATQARVSQASTDLANDVTAPHDTPAAKLPPATAYATPGAAGGTMRLEIAMSLHVTGNADTKQVGTSVAEKLKPALQEIIESAARRFGVALVVEEA